jgi:hypothetical protein
MFGDKVTNAAFWAIAIKNLGLSFGEVYRDLNKNAFLKSGQRYVMDGLILNVRISPSPVCTASLAVGQIVLCKILGGRNPSSSFFY